MPVPAVLHLTEEVELPGVSRELAWDWVADTDALNQASGMPPVEVQLTGSKLGNTTSLVTQQGGLFAMTWEEGPFEFVRPAIYRIERKVVKGPVTKIVFGAELRETPGGTLVRFFLELAPKNGLLAPFVRRAGVKQLREMCDRVRDLAAKQPAAGAVGASWSPPPSPLAPGAERLLNERVGHVRFAAGELADRLIRHLHEAPDHELLRIRPFELADRWNKPRMAVLGLLLHAAHAEILNISWDTMCPHCRVPSTRASKLSEVSADSTCEACDLSYTTDFDATVEVTFQVHASIRAIEPVKFCLGSPSKRKGLVFQQVLGPRETREVTVTLPAGDYVMMRADSENRAHFHVGDGGGRYAARIDKNGVERTELSMPGRGTGPQSFLLDSVLDGPVRVALALGATTADTCSAAMVTTFQDFRELFSSQVLSPGVQLSRASVTLLFTDLKSSTAMYQSHGDSTMYARVRDHFDVLTAAVRAEGGGVVKTIGDAVMASFPTPAAGVRAAIAMQRGITKMNAERGTPELTVKVGLHAGPCLVVNANDRLDYFGNTVNQAARIEGQSKGGDVVITDALATDPEVSSMFPVDGLIATTFSTALKGLTGDFTLTRIEIAGPSKPSAAAVR